MPILDLQRRMRELGRIRMGIQEEYRRRDGKTGMRPAKLATFRLTSASREYIDAAAASYGGEVRPWTSPRGPEFELVIASPTLDVMVPPDAVIDPWMELWRAGGCERRCDGRTNTLANGGAGGPCECPADPKARIAAAADGEACKPTTRLSVILPKLPDLGVWRLESHGYYAAVELTGTADVLRQATASGVIVRARLRIERRKVKRPGEPTKDFTVPVLELPDFVPDAFLPDGPVISRPQIAGPAAPPVPALPAGPALPERSTFRAPVPADAVPTAPAADRAAASGSEVDADSPTPDTAAPGASEGVVDGVFAESAPELTRERFRELLAAHRIAEDFASQAWRKAFGEAGWGDVPDTERRDFAVGLGIPKEAT